MTTPLQQTKSLAESHGLQFKDCGQGHVQIKGHGVLISYWPESKKKTVYDVTNGQRTLHCTPWNAVQLCLKAADSKVRPKGKVSKNGPDFALDGRTTNPAGLRHLYKGKIPPWDLPGDFRMTKSDQLRLQAHELLTTAQQRDWETNNEQKTTG